MSPCGQPNVVIIPKWKLHDNFISDQSTNKPPFHPTDFLARWKYCLGTMESVSI